MQCEGQPAPDHAQPSEQEQVRTMIELLEQDGRGESEHAVPGNDQELLGFLDTAVLEDLPTDLLVKLAAQLKDRRSKLFVADKNK